MITSNQILEAVAVYFGTNVRTIQLPGRYWLKVYYRNMAMLMLREFVPNVGSYSQIATALGYGNHTSAYHGIRQITHRIETDETVARDADRLRQHIQSYIQS